MTGINKLILATILVNDLDVALDFYKNKLGFILKHDLQSSDGDRWLTVAPQNQKELEIVLRKPRADKHELVTKEFEFSVGKSTLMTFSCTNLDKTYTSLVSKGVNFVSNPTMTVEGRKAVFEDIFGNRFSLLEIQ